MRLRLSVLDNFVPRSSRRTPETCRTQTCCKLQGDGDQTRAEGKKESARHSDHLEDKNTTLYYITRCATCKEAAVTAVLAADTVHGGCTSVSMMTFRALVVEISQCSLNIRGVKGTLCIFIP